MSEQKLYSYLISDVKLSMWYNNLDLFVVSTEPLMEVSSDKGLNNVNAKDEDKLSIFKTFVNNPATVAYMAVNYCAGTQIVGDSSIDIDTLSKVCAISFVRDTEYYFEPEESMHLFFKSTAQTSDDVVVSIVNTDTDPAPYKAVNYMNDFDADVCYALGTDFYSAIKGVINGTNKDTN